MGVIGHFPAQPHCFAYGGFDIQMNRVIDLLSSAGIESKRVNPWDQKSEFSIAHFWGGDVSHSISHRFCKERNIGTVFSVLLPNPPSTRSWRMRARGWMRRILKGQVLCANADRVLVINDDQAWVARYVLGIPHERICIVPTIVDDIFFDGSYPSTTRLGPILCVGTIGTRKNQLNFLRASEKLPNDVILCGRFDESEPEYCEAVKNVLRGSPQRIHHMQDISVSDLRDLYRQCSVLACVSHHETEPASVLEAMICRRPIVISDRPFGRNPRFNGANYCDPTNVASIQAALMKACESPAPTFPRFNPTVHRSDSVVNAYMQVYASIERSRVDGN